MTCLEVAVTEKQTLKREFIKMKALFCPNIERSQINSNFNFTNFITSLF